MIGAGTEWRHRIRWMDWVGFWLGLCHSILSLGIWKDSHELWFFPHPREKIAGRHVIVTILLIIVLTPLLLLCLKMKRPLSDCTDSNVSQQPKFSNCWTLKYLKYRWVWGNNSIIPRHVIHRVAIFFFRRAESNSICRWKIANDMNIKVLLISRVKLHREVEGSPYAYSSVTT